MSALSCTHVCRAECACCMSASSFPCAENGRYENTGHKKLGTAHELCPGSELLQGTSTTSRQREAPWSEATPPSCIICVQRLWFLPFGINTRSMGRHTFASACSFCSGRTWALKVCQLLMEIRCKWGGLKGCFHLQSTINSLLFPDVVRYDINTHMCVWRPHTGVALQMASFGFKYSSPGLYQ